MDHFPTHSNETREGDNGEESCTREERSFNIDTIDPLSDSVPEAVDSSSEKSVSSDSSSDDEELDHFDAEAVPMPSFGNTSIPVVLEVSSSNGSFASTDPLFNGVCLYDGSMSPTQTEAYIKTTSHPCTPDPPLDYSWFLPSAFQHLLRMRKQRVD